MIEIVIGPYDFFQNNVSNYHLKVNLVYLYNYYKYIICLLMYILHPNVIDIF